MYLFNFQDIAIRNILIAVRGYGDINGKPVETATFRYFIEDLKALDYVKIEPIQTDTLALFNEYWLSFQANDYMYDKKFILPPHTVVTENLTNIPFLNKMGYMLQ